MTIDWIRIAGALLLLLPPIALFHGKKIRYRNVDKDWDQHWRQALTLGTHVIDFARAIAGGWMLMIALGNADQNPVPATHGVSLIILLATIFLACALQTIIPKRQDMMHAPLFYVAGLGFGCFHVLHVSIALLLAIALTFGIRKPSLLFLVYAVSLTAILTLFFGSGYMKFAAIVSAGIVLPWVLSMMFQREFVVSYRARRPSDPAGDSTHSTPARDVKVTIR